MQIIPNANANTMPGDFSSPDSGKTQPYNGAAGAKLVHITELLEQILGYLPVRQVISTTRVAHVFRQLVRTSPIIRRSLFFREPLNVLGEQEWCVAFEAWQQRSTPLRLALISETASQDKSIRSSGPFAPVSSNGAVF